MSAIESYFTLLAMLTVIFGVVSWNLWGGVPAKPWEFWKPASGGRGGIISGLTLGMVALLLFLFIEWLIKL